MWAVIPPLLLLFYYHRRVKAKPLSQLLLCFGLGALSGLVALGLEWGFEHLASGLEYWDTRYLHGVALRQLLEVGPIEEGCKLAGVILFCQLPIIKRKARSPGVFLFTIAIALGFTAQENVVYLLNGTASIIDRLIGTPVHAMFSAPWGYALAMHDLRNDFSTRRHRGRLVNRKLITRAWVNAVVCHALVNVFSSAWRYPPPLRFLSYLLFPFLLWLFWRMEGLWRRVQNQPPRILISGLTPIHRYWQLGLVLFALMLGGNTLFGFFLLTRTLNSLSLFHLLYPDVLWFVVSRLLLNLIFGLVAWGIYRYLRRSASRG